MTHRTATAVAVALLLAATPLSSVAQQPGTYPLDDQLANTPAPSTVPVRPQRKPARCASTLMRNHVGTHLGTFAHIYRENSLFHNMPPPKPVGTVHGDAASVKFMVGRGVLLDVAKYKGQDPLPGN